MNLASELAGSSALERIQSRVQAYWQRQFEYRLIASLRSILASTVTNNSSDMVNDISAAAGTGANFSAGAVIDTAGSLGDHLENMKAIATHSAIYTEALKNDLIQFILQSSGLPIKTFRGLGIVIENNLSPASGRRSVRPINCLRSLLEAAVGGGGAGRFADD